MISTHSIILGKEIIITHQLLPNSFFILDGKNSTLYLPTNLLVLPNLTSWLSIRLFFCLNATTVMKGTTSFLDVSSVRLVVGHKIHSFWRTHFWEGGRQNIRSTRCRSQRWGPGGAESRSTCFKATWRWNHYVGDLNRPDQIDALMNTMSASMVVGFQDIF